MPWSPELCMWTTRCAGQHEARQHTCIMSPAKVARAGALQPCKQPAGRLARSRVRLQALQANPGHLKQGSDAEVLCSLHT